MDGLCAECGRPLATRLRKKHYDFAPLNNDDDAFLVLFDGKTVHVQCAPKQAEALAPPKRVS